LQKIPFSSRKKACQNAKKQLYLNKSILLSAVKDRAMSLSQNRELVLFSGIEQNLSPLLKRFVSSAARILSRQKEEKEKEQFYCSFL